MNQLSGAEALVRLLALHGVRHVFGLCGDTSLPFYDALYRLEHGMTHVLTRDERHAAYMADAYARVSGRPGVCEGPSGGGATYILPGVAEANESSVPLLAVTSDIGTAGRGRFVLTELDQAALFRPVAKWNGMIDRADDLPRLVRRAFRELTTGRPGAVHLGLPFDVQKAPVDEAELHADPVPVPRPAPATDEVERVARLLIGAERPVLLVGGGIHAAAAWQELDEVARLLQTPVATTVSGKGALADDHPLLLGVVGSNGGSAETRAVLDAADLIVLIGCRAGSVTTERWRHPAPGRQPIVHIDIDPRVFGANYRAEAALLADARLALAALRDHLDTWSGPRGWDAAARVAAAKAAKLARLRELAASATIPICPEQVIATLQDILPADSIVLADPGTPCPYVMAYLRQARPGRRIISNRAHGALGYALPAVLGAALARPEARCVALMGDGSFGMACGELETIARLGLPLALIVFSNATFGWIKAGQRAGFGGRYFSVDFGRTDHAAVARAFGLDAVRVERPDELTPALTRAIAADRPMLVDVICQPLHEAQAPVSEWIA